MAEAAKKKKIFDGRYEVLSIVGRGAASVVYHARHVGALSSEVALKVLVKPGKADAKPNNSDLLRKEALSMVSARHKYVVRLDDFHSVGDLCYLAMEFAPLGDTRKYVATMGGVLTPDIGELFLTQAAEALDFVHRVGIVHRDIKPDNILVISEKEIRLADFGVAVLPGETASMKDLQAGVGTMSYMAPEVLEGIAYDKRSDIYSLGVAFYELLSGIHPFEKAPLIKQLEVREDKNVAPLNVVAPSVPEHISNVIMQAISYDPARRFGSCQDLIQSLAIYKGQSGKPAATRVAPTTQPMAEMREAPVAKTTQPPREPTPDEPPFFAGESEESVIPSEEPPRRPAREPSADKIIDMGKPNPAPRERVRENVPPQPTSRGGTVHPAIENRKPKRSLEDLRKLARENKSSVVPAESRHTLRKEPPVVSRRRSLSSFFMMVIAAALAYILYSYYSNRSTPVEEQPAQEMTEQQAPASNALAFPELPSGVYDGTISNFLTGKEIPLSLISLGTERGTVVILGIPGFTPQLVIPKGGTQTLKIASNGMIIELSGEAQERSITGKVRNIVTGEKGSWSVERR